MFEELEQIPWSELVKPPKRPNPWVMAAVACLAALGVASFIVSRGPAPGPTAAPATTTPTVVEPTRVPAEVLLSEADLQASAGSGELAALGAAVVEVRASSSPTHYVEWAVAEDITPLAEDLWSVRVAYQVLEPGPNGPERSPVRRVEVPVSVEGQIVRRAGPIVLSSFQPKGPTDAWHLEDIPVSDDLRRSVEGLFSAWGPITISSAGTQEELVRVLIDTGSMQVAVWFDGGVPITGVPVPADS